MHLLKIMKQLTLNIADNKFKAFLEFIKTLDYVKVEEAEDKASEELQSSLNQIKLMKEGKVPKQAAKDFLNEL
jgi:predicted RNA-binding protein Jag